MSLRPDTAGGDFQSRIVPLLDRAAAYAYAIVRNRADAEDAVQDAALKAYRAFGKYDDSRPLKGWWLAIVRNCCRDLLRRRRSRPLPVALDRAESPLDDHPTALGDHPAHAARPDGARPMPGESEELREALQQLSAAHREVLEMRYFGDCSYREIAAALDIPVGTVMSRLYAARQALASVYRKGEV
jgi:RNA polymerase sigma-70 factor (ECF subfamily)